MKILRIVSAGYEQGGAENGIVLTNKLLRERGHTVKVISSDARPDLQHFSDFEFKGVPDKGFRKIIYAAFNYDAYVVTRNVLSEFKPDVVLLHTMSQPTAAVLFLLKKYPTIQFVHGPELFTESLIPWYLQKRDYKNGTYSVSDLTFSGRLHYYYFKYICGGMYRVGFHNINELVALSSYTLALLESEGHKARFMPNGAKLFKPAPLPKIPTLLYAGRLEKFKGVDDLIQSLPKVLKKIPSTKLLIAGEGNFGNDLKVLVEELRLTQSVHFLGHLKPAELASVYKKCSVFVLPSTWPETFGKVGIEAMSVGRPVIATDVGGVRDWLKDGVNGYSIQPHSPDQLSQKAVTLLSNNQKTERMAATAIETAQLFSIEQMADNIEKLAYELVVERGTPSGISRPQTI